MTHRPLPRRRHDEATIYAVSVLWLIGYSRGRIARAVGLRPGQVAAIVRLAGYENRAAITVAERQTMLDGLKEAGLDEGRLGNIEFQARSLGRRQERTGR